MIVSATDIALAYGGRRVLEGFSVHVQAGETYALTGRSGSGKTTLLLVLAGLLKPTSGSLDLSLPREQLLYVPQAPSLVPELTALQNASLGLRLRGIAPELALQRAGQQLRLLGLDDVDEALPTQLSGGMQQRVALARALAVEPRLLLADEPTGALDQATGRQVVQVLNDYATRTEGAVIVATHDPIVASAFHQQLSLERVQAA